MGTEIGVAPVRKSRAPARVPPVLLFIPGLSAAPSNTASRIADIIARDLDLGDGAYAVHPIPTPARGTTSALSDCRRISRVGGDPVLDICTADYRPVLRRPVDLGSGARGAVTRLAFVLVYFLETLLAVLGARGRAKTVMARFQLVWGFGVVLLMLVSVVFTVLAALDVVGWWRWSPAPETWSNALALGLTAFTTWLVTRARPGVAAAGEVVRQVVDYVKDERFASTVDATVARALDELLDEHPNRPVHLLGYSFGSIVAVDFLNPRRSSSPLRDPRYAVITSLTTIGCPLDFIRLFFPRYLDDRVPLSTPAWQNVFIPADVFGSNLRNDDDFGQGDDTQAVAERHPTSLRYTDEELSLRGVLWRFRGFAAHAAYWGGVDESSCLTVLHSTLLAGP